jgi:hypothetical protein
MSAAGPIINAIVSVSGPRILALQKAGQPVPPSIPVRALIDTGASSTCIDSSLVGPLGITPTGTIPIHTPTTGGVPHVANQYDVGLMIPGGPTDPPLVQITLPVTDHALAVQGIQALIGRDVLAQCLLSYNGVMRLFTLAY